MRAVIDTNVLIDYMTGVVQAPAELALYQRPSISVITWIEMIAGATPQSEGAVRAFLMTFEVLDIDAKIAERAASVRRSKRIKLPDAIIWATAQVHHCLLVTRNTRDFDPKDPSVRVPYTI